MMIFGESDFEDLETRRIKQLDSILTSAFEKRLITEGAKCSLERLGRSVKNSDIMALDTLIDIMLGYINMKEALLQKEIIRMERRHHDR